VAGTILMNEPQPPFEQLQKAFDKLQALILSSFTEVSAPN